MNQQWTTRPSDHPLNRRRMWSRAVLVRYWAMQLPAVAIVLFVALSIADGLSWPGWVAWAIVAAWTAKDALLYLFVWPAYDPGYVTPFPYRMEGATGTAVHCIERSGTIRVWGELWHAELARSGRQIEEGEKVRVTRCHGLTLFVEPVESR